MDFLLLLSPHERVVIEVDGKQHYAEGDVASPGLYAEMVAADRDLRLLGYEVYRFGGAEFSKDRVGNVLDVFFRRLFERHRRV
jgi:very-short-patch-repair endonuclease